MSACRTARGQSSGRSGSCTSRRAAARVARRARAARARAYDVAIGADHKAHSSAQKSVLKVQYASLVERITAVEMEADDARDAADTSAAAANEAAALLAAERRSRAAEVNARVGARSDSARERAREAVGEEMSRAAKRLRKEQAVTAGLRASGVAKDRRMLKLRESSPAALLAAQKERAALNRRIRQLDLELDDARRDAAAARADAAAARADGAADRAKIASLRIPKVNGSTRTRTRTQRTQRTRARRGAAPPPGPPL